MRTDALGCIATALGRVAAIAAFCLAALPAGANNTVGAWSTVRSWPLIAVHAVLMPDGRVLTYGTSATGQQTAIFIYDVWDPSQGLDAGHTTLPNMTAVDIFCSSQVVLPVGRPGLHRRRRQLDRLVHDEHRQQRQHRVRVRQQHADEDERHEPRALVLVLDHAAERRDLHPGRRRRHRPAGDPRHQRRVPPDVRREHQRVRLHVPAQLRRAGRPRLRLRQRRAHVLRQHLGDRRGDDGRHVQRSDRQRCERGDVPAGQDPAVRRQCPECARHRHHGRLARGRRRRSRSRRSVAS